MYTFNTSTPDKKRLGQLQSARDKIDASEQTLEKSIDAVYKDLDLAHAVSVKRHDGYMKDAANSDMLPLAKSEQTSVRDATDQNDKISGAATDIVQEYGAIYGDRPSPNIRRSLRVRMTRARRC